MFCLDRPCHFKFLKIVFRKYYFDILEYIVVYKATFRNKFSWANENF